MENSFTHPSIHPFIHPSIQQMLIEHLPQKNPVEIYWVQTIPPDPAFYNLIKEIREDVNTKNYDQGDK